MANLQLVTYFVVVSGVLIVLIAICCAFRLTNKEEPEDPEGIVYTPRFPERHHHCQLCRESIPHSEWVTNHRQECRRENPDRYMAMELADGTECPRCGKRLRKWEVSARSVRMQGFFIFEY